MNRRLPTRPCPARGVPHGRGPAPAADKLAAARTIQAPDSLARLQADAAIAVGCTPAEIARFIAYQHKRWKPVRAQARNEPD